MYQEIFYDLLSKFKKRKLLMSLIIFSVNEKKKPSPLFIFFFDKVGGGLLHCEAYKKKISSLNYLI